MATDKVQGKSERKSQVERGRISPGFSLDEALQFLAKIFEQAGTRDSSGELIAKALGHMSRTGPANHKIGALTHFGLITRAGRGAYRVSGLGRSIMQPKNGQERLEALAAAAKSPTLYGELFEMLKGSAIPGLLQNILVRDYGVSQANSMRTAENFRKSMESAGLLHNGVLSDSQSSQQNTEVDAEGSEKIEERKSTLSQPGVKVTATSAASPAVAVERSYSIPLSGGRICVLQIPLHVAKADLKRIKDWIGLMEDVLIEKAADSESAASSMSQGQAEPPNGTPDGASA